jgi:hypothetical protein
MLILTNMKKILGIFLITAFLFTYPCTGYVYAEDDTAQEETENTEDADTNTEEETTSLSETLDETSNSSISWWTILLSVLGISLFIAVVYYVLKNFNIGTGK